MGMDFWAVEMKEGITDKDICNDWWACVTGKELTSIVGEDINKYSQYQNDDTWCSFCCEVIGTFVGSFPPISEDSKKEINELADRLNTDIRYHIVIRRNL